MTSAWGDAWGVAWGDAWGTVAQPQPVAPPGGGYAIIAPPRVHALAAKPLTTGRPILGRPALSVRLGPAQLAALAAEQARLAALADEDDAIAALLLLAA
jgi:hypothetical protein